MSKHWKVLAVVGVLVTLSAGITYAGANQYDTEAYGDAVRGIIIACGAYIVAWLKSPE
jgi:hypothetical protein